MKLSIIIPCRNEEVYIESCLRSVFENDFPSEEYEVIIVDGQSDDQTLMILEHLKAEFPNLKVIHNPGRIAPIAMNLGIEEAKGDLIMRMDAHSYYPPNYISELVQWKEKLKADNIGAIWDTDVLNKTPKTIAIKKVLSHKFGVGNGLFRIGVEEPMEVDTVPFGCYHRSVFEEVGKYDERLRRNQDIELNKRLSAAHKKIVLIPFTFCRYYARETLKALARNNYQNGKWNLITVFYTKNLKSLSIRHFVPLMFFLSLTMPILLALIWWPLIGLSFLSLLFYALALFGVVSKMDRSGTSFGRLLLTFFMLHISYGWGSFVGLFHFYKLFK